jgi:hypothetical protein
MKVGVNSNTFWRLMKRISNHNNKGREYTTVDENGKPITDAQEEKEYIATYFGDLYQAREADPSHDQWTNHIKQTVELIQKDTEETSKAATTPFNLVELNYSIKTLK